MRSGRPFMERLNLQMWDAHWDDEPIILQRRFSNRIVRRLENWIDDAPGNVA